MLSIGDKNMSDTNNISCAKVTSEIPFEQRIKDFVQKNSPKLYILTPCYGSLCYVNYVHCLMNTKELIKRNTQFNKESEEQYWEELIKS